MKRATLFAAVLVAAAVVVGVPGLGAQSEANALRSTSPLTILQLNDVYSIAPVDGLGGLARIATLKQRVAAEGRTPLLVISGDFLSSSVESSIFKGEQMIAALNSAGIDIGALGNHEFDFGLEVLLARMSEARWQWVVSNVVDTATNRPVGGAPPYVVRTFGQLRVGFIGLCVTDALKGREGLTRLRAIDPLEAAATQIQALKKEGVDAIVALTHLTYEEDRALAERFPEIDVIVGGHEHFPITTVVNRTLISKSGTQGRLVARIDLNRSAAGQVERFFELVPITSAIPEEPRTAATVKSYQDRLSAELDTIVATTRVGLDAVNTRVRTAETNLGNLIADAMRAHTGSDIAIVNSGGIRGDRVYQPGPVRIRTLIEIHPFGNIVCEVAVSGRVLLDALNHGMSELPLPGGQFPQIAGMRLSVDKAAPAGRRVTDVRVQGVPLDPDRIYRLALPDYLLNGGDGYTMFANQRVLIDPETGDQIAVVLERYLRGRGEVAPETDGRIVIR
jgi:5'-nucleotidase